MEPVDYLRVLGRRWLVVALAILIAVLAAWLTTPSTTGRTAPSFATYQAQATLIQPPDTQRSLSYVSLFVTKGEVPERVADKIDYDGDPAQLATEVQVTANDQLGTLTISMTGSDKARVTELPNVFGQEIIDYLRRSGQEENQTQIAQLNKQITKLQEQITTAQEERTSGEQDAVLEGKIGALQNQYQSAYSQLLGLLDDTSADPHLEFLQEATPLLMQSGGFTAPSSRNGRLGIALVLGLVLGAVLALVLERFDTRIRTRDVAEAAFGLPVLVEIPKFPPGGGKAGSVISVTAPGGDVAESFRALRSALMLLPPQRLLPVERGAEGLLPDRPSAPEVIMVTSPRPRDGKTITTANLAACFAETGRRVLVLDVDFRNPEIRRYLPVPDDAGLSDVLASGGEVDLGSVAQQTTIPGVSLVAAGSQVARTHGFAARTPEIVAAARELADIVLIDTGPMLLSTEALELLPCVDTVLLISRVARTSREHAARATETLARHRAPVTGVALVGTPRLSSILTGQLHSGSFTGRSRLRQSNSRDEEQRA